MTPVCFLLASCGGGSKSTPTPPPATVQAATPTFSPAAGTFTSAQSVSIADTTAGATVYYTTDGSAPTAASTVFTAPIPVAATTTLNAIATATGDSNSAVATGKYVINLPAPAAPPAPGITPDGGSFTTAQSVTLSDSVAGATIYYTLDGSTPTAASSKYTSAITISATGTTTVKAIASIAGAPLSTVASAIFNLAIASAQPSYTYKNVQIVGGGFVDGLYFHPKQQGLMYAHTDVGGAYRWNNVAGGDAQWVPLTDWVGRYNSGFDIGVAALAIDPNDATRLYLAVGDYTESYGGNGAILISGDMGKTFTTVELPFKNGANDIGRNDGERLVVDPNNGNHLYFGTFQNGLWESLDQGATWSQVTAFPITGATSNLEDPEVGVIFEDFVASSGKAPNGNSKTVYYGVSSPTAGLYVSNDGGATFSVVPNQPTGYYANSTSLDTANDILYVSYGVNQGCTSSCDNSGPYGPNAGQIWAYHLPTTNAPNGVWANITPPQTTPAGGSYAYSSVVVDPNHPNVVMLTTLNKYYPAPYDDVFRSVDSGATWVNLGTNIVRDGSLSPWNNFNQSFPDGGNWLNHLVVDPFNSNHAMYGDGQTIWQTTDIGDADGVATSTTVTNHGNATHWSIGALGVEETVITDLVSPSSGPAHLLSQMGDLGGFTHTDLTVSPAGGAQSPPLFTTGTSIDYAQNNPMIVARVGTSSGSDGTYNQPPGSLVGAYSVNGGLAWTQFVNNPTGVTTGGGTIAVSADGSTFVWAPYDAGVAPVYSTDKGTTWTSSTAPVQTSSSQITVYADRINPKKFYVFDTAGSNGQTPIYVSTDGGHTFAVASTPANYNISMSVSPHAEGDLWFTSYNGLFHSTNSGATVTQVTGVPVSYGIGFGAAAPGATYPAVYMVGQVQSDTGCVAQAATAPSSLSQCVYRSIDGGTTFVRINDAAHQYGSFSILTGDPRVFGRVYLGTGGRGIIEGDSPN